LRRAVQIETAAPGKRHHSHRNDSKYGEMPWIEQIGHYFSNPKFMDHVCPAGKRPQPIAK
jgi:hypothetical protein